MAKCLYFRQTMAGNSEQAPGTRSTMKPEQPFNNGQGLIMDQAGPLENILPPSSTENSFMPSTGVGVLARANSKMSETTATSSTWNPYSHTPSLSEAILETDIFLVSY